MNNPFRSGYNMPDGCFSTSYDKPYHCERCGREVKDIEDLTEVENEMLFCDDCLVDYFECEHCKHYHHVDDMSAKEDVCIECYEDMYVQCPICLTHFNVEDSEHYDEDTNKLCDKCYEELKHL